MSRLSEFSVKGLYISSTDTYATEEYIKEKICKDFAPTPEISYRYVQRWGKKVKVYSIADVSEYVGKTMFNDDTIKIN